MLMHADMYTGTYMWVHVYVGGQGQIAIILTHSSILFIEVVHYNQT